MKVEIQGSGKEFILVEEYSINTCFGLVIIPKGFKTDLASIPKIFWSIISPLEAHFPAAVLHDYFYRVPLARKIGGIILSREQVDNVFLEEMFDLKISWCKRKVMYYVVRFGGNSSWKL